MSKIDREMKAFQGGMEYALRMIRMVEEKKGLEEGVKAAEEECRYRSKYPLQPYVSVGRLHNEARGMMQTELEMVSIANLVTLVDDLKLPPSTIKKFLHGYNSRTDAYRINPELFQKEVMRMSQHYEIAKISIDFMNE